MTEPNKSEKHCKHCIDTVYSLKKEQGLLKSRSELKSEEENKEHDFEHVEFISCNNCGKNVDCSDYYGRGIVQGYGICSGKREDSIPLKSVLEIKERLKSSFDGDEWYEDHYKENTESDEVIKNIKKFIDKAFEEIAC